MKCRNRCTHYKYTLFPSGEWTSIVCSACKSVFIYQPKPTYKSNNTAVNNENMCNGAEKGHDTATKSSN